MGYTDPTGHFAFALPWLIKIAAVVVAAVVVGVAAYQTYQVAKNAQPYIKEGIEQSINTTKVVASVATEFVTYEIEKHKAKKETKKSAKEGATDVPSWAKGQRPKKGENGKKFAERLCNERYGKGNYSKGTKSDYNKIKKWGDRHFKK